jgi:hypothetical protein
MLTPGTCSAKAVTNAPAFKSVANVLLKTTDIVIGAPGLAEMVDGKMVTSAGPHEVNPMR